MTQTRDRLLERLLGPQPEVTVQTQQHDDRDQNATPFQATNIRDQMQTGHDSEAAQQNDR